MLRPDIRSVGGHRLSGRPTGRTLLGMLPAFKEVQSPASNSTGGKEAQTDRRRNGDGGGQEAGTPSGNGTACSRSTAADISPLPLRDFGQTDYDTSRNRLAEITSPLRAVWHVPRLSGKLHCRRTPFRMAVAGAESP